MWVNAIPDFLTHRLLINMGRIMFDVKKVLGQNLEGLYRFYRGWPKRSCFVLL